MAGENRGPQVEAVTILFLTLSWVFVTLRCYVRGILMKNFGLDDGLAVVALILFSLYCTFVLLGVKYGTGRHLADLPPRDIPIAIKWWWCCELNYVASTAVLKASIGIFLNRICVRRGERLTIYVVIGVVTVFSIFYFFLIVFQCTPSTYFWTQYLGATGTCLPTSVIVNASYAHAAISAAADWTLGILPIFLVWNLSMTPRAKVSVGLILALGAVGSTATVVRIPYLKQLALPDFLYNTTDVAIWSTVEPGIGITASAMATLRPLFRTFLGRSNLFGSSTRGNEATDPTIWRSQKHSRANYFRSGSTSVEGNDLEELGLRSDIGNGIGVTTVIKCTTNANEDVSKSMTKGPRMRTSEDHLKDDSSEEFSPRGRWDVTKTTVFTTQESDSKELGLGGR